MDLVAEQRVLVGVDVIGSAAKPGADLHRLSQAWRAILHDSLLSAGIGPDDIVEREEQGDGALLTLPHARLGSVVDMSQRLQELTVAHNQQNRPEVRLRMAVETGPVPEGPTYSRPKIDRARLLDASAFKDLLAHCHSASADGAHSGLIISDHAFRTVFGGNYTALVRSSEFARLTVESKEYRASAWVRVPGFDARSLQTFIETGSADGKPVVPGAVAPVHNEVHGTMNGVQAQNVHGGISFGAVPR